MAVPNAPAPTPSSALPASASRKSHGKMGNNYRIAIVIAVIVVGISVIGFSAGSRDVGGPLWTGSLMGIALGILTVAAAYSIGTREQFSASSIQEQDSYGQIRESFESLAGRDWMTGLDTFSELTRQVGRELSRSTRYDRPFSVMFVTPRFRGNTAALTQGHVSDIEIYAAELLRTVLRFSDGIARRTDVFGFAALLPETDIEGGEVVANRIGEALVTSYKVGPWDDQTEMIALEAEVLTYPRDQVPISQRFGLDASSSDAPTGTTLAPNI